VPLWAAPRCATSAHRRFTTRLDGFAFEPDLYVTHGSFGCTDWAMETSSGPRRAFDRTTGPLTFEEHISALDRTRLWMACTNEPAGGQADRVLYRSTDGGRHWRLASRACCFGNDLQLVAVSWGYGWATDDAGGYALARVSVRGGRTIPVADTEGLWVSLHFLRSPVGFGWAATSTNLLYLAADRGNKWDRPTNRGDEPRVSLPGTRQRPAR